MYMLCIHCKIANSSKIYWLRAFWSKPRNQTPPSRSQHKAQRPKSSPVGPMPEPPSNSQPAHQILYKQQWLSRGRRPGGDGPTRGRRAPGSALRARRSRAERPSAGGGAAPRAQREAASASAALRSGGRRAPASGSSSTKRSAHCTSAQQVLSSN